jgi:hypothetical protein
MIAAWRWLWTVAVLAIWPLTLATYIETRTPLVAWDHHRAVAAVAALEDEIRAGKVVFPVPADACVPRSVTVCPVIPPCWEVRKPGC